jgi:protein-L-isoaspartate(D-aspartate) O-methyltransferase
MKPVERAFEAVDRKKFVPAGLADRAFIDAPLPIGFGQTISQPTTVKMMLKWLQPEPGDKILDVGSGSGWTTALLSHLVGPNGKIYAVELIPELVKFGRDNAQKADIKNAKFFKADKTIGLPKYAPYDRILVSAAGRQLPQELLNQLADGGKLVIPVNHDILEIEKENSKITTKKHPGFIFVPLLNG